MRRSHFGIELLILEASILAVSICLLACSAFVAINIYTVYTSAGTQPQVYGTTLTNTRSKVIEVCKPNFILCSGPR